MAIATIFLAVFFTVLAAFQFYLILSSKPHGQNMTMLRSILLDIASANFTVGVCEIICGIISLSKTDTFAQILCFVIAIVFCIFELVMSLLTIAFKKNQNN